MLKGNPNYRKYLNETINTSAFNAVELLYYMLKYHESAKVEEKYAELNLNIVEIEKNELFEAAKLRHAHKKKALSYSDCVGYTLAEKRGMKFLTGDNDFRGMGNTEFVK